VIPALAAVAIALTTGPSDGQLAGARVITGFRGRPAAQTRRGL